MFKEKAKGFIAGICVAAILTCTISAFAANINVEIGGIKVFWDGVEKNLTNAKGEKVEPMIYDGTTYVPVRAMSNLLGKDVYWDQATTSVYVGERPVAKTTSIVDMEENINGSASWWYILQGKDASFTLKNKEVICENLLNSNLYQKPEAIYMLDGNYSRLVGKFVVPYTEVGSNATGKIEFYSVENDGTSHEIAKYERKAAQDPIDIDINLRGVTNLRINCYGDVAFYDVSFLGK